jgi:hypothetical protein
VGFGPFESVLRAQVLAGRELSLAQLAGPNVQPPGGELPYLYGEAFLAWVAGRFGLDKVIEFYNDYDYKLIPFQENRGARAAFGRSWGELYDQWLAELRARWAGVGQRVEVGRSLTSGGEHPEFPLADGGRVLFLYSSGDGLDEIRRLDPPPGPGSGQSGTMETLYRCRGGCGRLSLDPAGRRLFFQKGEFARLVYLFQDLYVLDLATRGVRAVTHGARLHDPAWCAGTGTVLAARTVLGRTDLVEVEPGTGEVRSLLGFEPGVQIGDPTCLEDGRVVFLGHLDRQWDLWAWARGEAEPRRLTDDRAVERDLSAVPGLPWVVYSAPDEEGVPRVRVLDVSEKRRVWLTNSRTADFFPSWGGPGTPLYLVRVQPDGQDLVEVSSDELDASTGILGVRGAGPPPDRGRAGAAGSMLNFNDFASPQAQGRGVARDVSLHPQRPARFDERSDADGDAGEGHATTRPGLGGGGGTESPREPASQYSPWPSIRPRAWVPTWYLDDGGLRTVGVQVSGQDALGHHSFTLAADADLTHGRPEASLDWVYSGTWPTLVASAFTVATDDVSFYNDALHAFPRAATGGALAASLALPSAAHTWSFDLRYAFTHYNRLSDPRRVDYQPDSLEPWFPPTEDVGELLAGVSFDSRETYAYSISPERGLYARLSTAWRDPWLGGGERLGLLRLRLQLPLALPWPRHGVLNLDWRAGASASAGGSRSIFGLGGTTCPPILQQLINQEYLGDTGLRGFPPGAQRGRYVHSLDTELRLPLARVYRGLWDVLPVFFRKLHATFYADLGQAFSELPPDNPLLVGVGGELILGALLFHGMAFNLVTGYAQGLTQGGLGVWYLYLGL